MGSKVNSVLFLCCLQILFSVSFHRQKNTSFTKKQLRLVQHSVSLTPWASRRKEDKTKQQMLQFGQPRFGERERPESGLRPGGWTAQPQPLAHAGDELHNRARSFAFPAAPMHPLSHGSWDPWGARCAKPQQHRKATTLVHHLPQEGHAKLCCSAPASLGHGHRALCSGCGAANREAMHAIPLLPSLYWLRTHIVHQPACVTAKYCAAPHHPGSSTTFFHEPLPGTRAVCWLMARDEFLHSTWLVELWHQMSRTAGSSIRH